MEEKNYLNMYGSLTHCWKVHRAVMQREHQPRVTYPTFRHRVRNLHWDAYKAIHTPAHVEKRDKNRRRKVKCHIILYKVKKFFRKIFCLGCSEKK